MGTLNKFAGKIKSLFRKPWKTNDYVQESFKDTMADITGRKITEGLKVKSTSDKPKSVLKRSTRGRLSNKSPWWIKFYGKRTRTEVGPLNKHMVGHFGSFSPVKKAGE